MDSSKSVTENQRRRLTYCLYVVGFLDLFAVSMLIPLLSQHLRALGASPAQIGSILSMYGGLQLFTGPVVGRWSDVSGRRFVLLICLSVTCASYFAKGIATSLTLLVLSRIPLGIFKHGMAITKGLIAEFTPAEDRPRVFGQYNACSAMGFIIGPLIGGHLAEAEDGFNTVATITAALFLLDVAVVYFLVHPPNSDHTLARTKSVAAFTTSELTLNLKDFIKSFQLIVHSCFDLFLVRFLMGFSVMIYRTNFSLTLQEMFDITPKTIGQVMSYGALVGFLSGMCTGRIVKFYGDINRLLLHTSIATAINIFGLTFAPNIPIFLFFSTTLAITNAVSRVCITDMSVRRGSVANTGALLGTSQSLASMSRAIAPFIGGVAQEFTFKGPGIIGVVSASLGVICIVTYLQKDDGPDEEEQKKD